MVTAKRRTISALGGTFAEAFERLSRVGKRGLYRAGYARALDDVAAALRNLEVGSTAAAMADALDAKAEAVRRVGTTREVES